MFKRHEIRFTPVIGFPAGFSGNNTTLHSVSDDTEFKNTGSSLKSRRRIQLQVITPHSPIVPADSCRAG